MRVTIWNRIMLVAVILAVSLVGMGILTNAQEPQQQETKKQQQDKKKQQDQKQQQRAQQQQQEQNRQQQKRAQQQEQIRQQQQRAQQQQQQDQNRQRQPERLSQQRQQQLIEQQQQQMTQYRQRVDQEARIAQQRIAQLQQQNRMTQYRFQQQYLERLRQQQIRFQNDRAHDYYIDPYYYTAPNYRYFRGGIYYETNQYGVDLLRQAVNYGYAEGFQAGQADRMDGWHSSYRDSFAYQDANYGYDGYYVDQDAYNYYFREGFRRGYDDGYRSRFRYGRYDDGTYRILDGILGGILILRALR